MNIKVWGPQVMILMIFTHVEHRSSLLELLSTSDVMLWSKVIYSLVLDNNYFKSNAKRFLSVIGAGEDIKMESKTNLIIIIKSFSENCKPIYFPQTVLMKVSTKRTIKHTVNA